MLTQIQNIVSGITGINDERETLEPTTVLEQLEQENPQNVTERHLLTSEKEYENSGRVAQYGIQISSGIIINSAITYGILHSIEGLTLSFNPFTYLLICGGVNAITSAITTDNSKNARTNLMLGTGKFVVNMAVNGSLIGQVDKGVSESRIVVDSVRREIENYENGYKNQTPDYGLMALVIAGFIFAILIIPKTLSNKQ